MVLGEKVLTGCAEPAHAPLACLPGFHFSLSSKWEGAAAWPPSNGGGDQISRAGGSAGGRGQNSGRAQAAEDFELCVCVCEDLFIF